MSGGLEKAITSRDKPSQQADAEDDVAAATGSAVPSISVSDGDLPLAGIRVIDLGNFVSGPQSALILGQFGAEVLKLEQPAAGDAKGKSECAGSVQEAMLAWSAGGGSTRRVTFDLGRARNVELFRKLIAKADVLIENVRPGALEESGLSREVLRQINPGLILLRVSAARQSTSPRRRQGPSPLAHAFTGLAYLADFFPVAASINPDSQSLDDYLTSVHGAISVMAALRHKQQTGRGQVIETSSTAIPPAPIDMLGAAKGLGCPNDDAAAAANIIPFPLGLHRPRGDS